MKMDNSASEADPLAEPSHRCGRPSHQYPWQVSRNWLGKVWSRLFRGTSTCLGKYDASSSPDVCTRWSGKSVPLTTISVGSGDTSPPCRTKKIVALSGGQLTFFRCHTIDHSRSPSTKWPSRSLGWNRVPVCVLTVITGLITGEPKHASAAEGGASTPVILISIDTLRADRLSSYGSKRPTPNIDALAKSGTLFSAVNAAAPLTLPSHVSLFTSTYPFVHGITDNGERLVPNTTTLARVLKSKGYLTAAFVGGFVMDRSLWAGSRFRYL